MGLVRPIDVTDIPPATGEEALVLLARDPLSNPKPHRVCFRVHCLISLIFVARFTACTLYLASGSTSRPAGLDALVSLRRQNNYRMKCGGSWRRAVDPERPRGGAKWTVVKKAATRYIEA